MRRAYKVTRTSSGNVLAHSRLWTIYCYRAPTHNGGKLIWRAYAIMEAHYLNDDKPSVDYVNTDDTLLRLLRRIDW